MITISAGTDTYGRVKSVHGTPIVTKFAMLQFIPLFPLESIYLTGAGSVSNAVIPFVASFQSVETQGIRLANTDRTSVLMAYVRSAFASIAVLGFIGVIFPGVTYMSGTRLDEFAMSVLKCMSIALIFGVVGGATTYVIPLTTRRERRIRSSCYQVLGVAIDPAKLPAETAELVLELADELSDRLDEPRLSLIRDLICLRAKLALETSNRKYETNTDELLLKLHSRFRL